MAGRRRGPFIAGNWKMNLGLQEARELARKVVEAEPELRECTTVLIPPFTALEIVRGAIAGSTVGLGAQNLYWEDAGAFTGEISAPMLRDAGCAYVLVGHSERRQLFGETDGTVNLKAKAALKAGLVPIVCVGEVLAERDAGRTLERIDEQLAQGLEGIAGQDLARVVVDADDDADLVNACVTNRFDDSEEHWFVGNGHELFGAGIRQRIQTGALAATQDEPFHRL